MPYPSKPNTRAAWLVVALLLVGAGCGGGAKPADPPATASSTTAAAVSPDVVAAFTAADSKQATAFEAAGNDIKTARAAKDVRAAQVGGRAARTALSDFDASLRRISFPPAIVPTVNTLLGSLAKAIAAFDEQNVATDEASFLAVDAKTGPAVTQARADMEAVRIALGLPATPQPAAPTTATTAPATSQPPLARAYISGDTITDAKAWRDDLLVVGKANVDAKSTRSSSFGIVEAWVGAFPFVKRNVVGSSVDAPATGISGFTANNANSKEPASATNPVILAFAVKDASGGCAAGVLYGPKLPDTPKPLTLAAGATCNGDEARKAAIAAGFG